MADHTWGFGPKHVLIHLEDPNDPIPQRWIMLDDEKKVVEVGRASKVPSKGFLAASDNAWFNSPVMSRHHAEIVADVERETVSIRDLGSLHGTFVNSNVRLHPQELKELKRGDTITFGQAIYRGSAEFLPTSAHISHVSFNHRDGNSTTTFQVPDGSECSSDVDDDYSSDRDSIKDGNNDKGKAAQTAPTKVHPITIDLTEHNHDVIDLSSPPSSPARMETEGNTSTFIEVDDDENEDHYNEDKDDDEEDEEEDDQSEDDRESLPPSSPTTDAMEIDDEMDMGLVLEDDELVHHSEDLGDLRDSLGSDDYPSEEDEDEESFSVSGSDESSGHESDLDEDMGSDDDVSIGGTDGSENEGRQEDFDFEHTVFRPQTVREVKWNHLLEHIANDADAYPDYSLPHVTVPAFQAAPAPFASDFASAPKTSDSMKIGKLLNGNPDQEPAPVGLRSQYGMYSYPNLYMECSTAAEELGQKTGKAEFFAAREYNKNMFAQAKEAPIPIQEPTEPEPESLQASVSDVATSSVDRTLMMEGAALLFKEIASFDADVGFHHCKRTHVGISDIIEGAPKKLKRKSDEIAETTPEEEKWVAAEKQKDETSKKQEAQPVTEEESIQAATGEDSIQNQADADAENKVETIAQVKDDAEVQGNTESKTEDNIQTATPPPSLPEEDSTPESILPEEKTCMQAVPVLAEAEIMATQAQAQDDQQRPAKRVRLLRSIAEHVGMAAIGGAMVMGTLIYTAPTFA